MTRPALAADVRSPAVLRLSRLAPLTDADLAALERAVQGSRTVRIRSELLREGQEIAETRLLASGWAARVRLLSDGRRQFLNFLLPGDLIGLCRQPRPLAVSTVVALTEVALCPLPVADLSPRLEEAYAASHALEEAYLLNQIVRLGRLNAQERIGDMLLELLERLELAHLAGSGSFDLPLTQEALADALGLTSVHINRMLQQMRRDGDFTWKGGRVTIRDPAMLAERIGRGRVRISAPAETVPPGRPHMHVARQDGAGQRG